MDFVVAQLALIFLPGIIWANIDEKYGVGLKPSPTTFIIRAFLFGMTTYVVLYIVYTAKGLPFGYDDLGRDVTSINLFALKDEISWSVPLALVLSVVWLWCIRYRLLMKFLHCIGATRRYGDEDVWSYTFNSDQAHVEYIHLRDLENGFVFAGWINTFSETEEHRELLLRDAIVYDMEGLEVSKSPYLYLSRPRGCTWIEFPYTSEGNDNV